MASWNMEYYHQYLSSERLFSQMDMCLVQVAFFASFVCHASQYGISYASEQGGSSKKLPACHRFVCKPCAIFLYSEDLMALIHFWRVVGWCLGIDDKYNLGSGDSFHELHAFYMEIVDKIIIPSFLTLDQRAIFMGKMVCIGHGQDYHLMVYKQFLGNVNMKSELNRICRIDYFLFV